ncbi:HNH endonuclease signature motif containing protein [Demequina capsici]|uniref:DUF222 domain-containing protein n=1 Tax=Demequina capsici TaxID=3075620 RepID=A0AA96F793_9MICO|nr:DUF222 domain-containing protein [Demequina sp. OYTSA14]WNM24894.1 DUF222 domain-containing protein [Demequina sp. OYTSA14]
MNITTAEIARAMRALQHFDGRSTTSLSESELMNLMDALSRLGRIANTTLAACAGEVERRSRPELGRQGLARRNGFRTPAHLVAAVGNGTVGSAHQLIETGKVMADAVPPVGEDARPGQGHSHLTRAIADGLLDSECAALISRTLRAVTTLRTQLAAARDAGGPSAPTHESAPWTEPSQLEASLVETATTHGIGRLRRACLQARAAADPVAWERRERQARDERYLVMNTDEDGIVNLRARLDAASAAPLATWLEGQVRDAFQRRRDAVTVPSGDTRSAGQIRVDALAALARHGLGCEADATAPTTTVVVRVAEADLQAGVGLADCDDLPAPVSVGALRRMAVDLQVLPAVLGGKSEPLDLGRTRRLFSRAQRLALGERDGGCAICQAPPTWCEAHHIRWWTRDSGRTDLDNGVLLCTNCHHRVHDGTWEIHADNGRIMVRPPASVDPARLLRPAGRSRTTGRQRERTGATAT